MKTHDAQTGATGALMASRDAVSPNQYPGNPTKRVHCLADRLISWAPLIVGGAFLYYGSGKLLKLNETIISINFLVNQGKIATVIGVLVAATDLYLGYLLLFTDKSRGKILAAFACLCAYSGFLIYLLSVEHPPGCGCGGTFKIFASNRANAAFGLARNMCFLGLLAVYYRSFLARKQVSARLNL